MTTKQVIQQYPGLKAYVKNCIDPFDGLASLAKRPPAADSLARYNRLCALHDADLQRARWRKEFIENVLGQLEPRQRNVLYYHVIKGLSFYRTSVEMNYSDRHVRRIYSQAVAEVKKILASVPADQTK